MISSFENIDLNLLSYVKTCGFRNKTFCVTHVVGKTSFDEVASKKPLVKIISECQKIFDGTLTHAPAIFAPKSAQTSSLKVQS